MFSLDPVDGYKPPILAGHKDTVLAAFFAGTLPHNPQSQATLVWHKRLLTRGGCAGAKVAEDARLSGEEQHALYTASRDGALFCWVYEKGEPPAKRQRLDSAATADSDGGEQAGLGPSSEAEARADTFSGTPLVLKCVLRACTRSCKSLQVSSRV